MAASSTHRTSPSGSVDRLLWRDTHPAHANAPAPRLLPRLDRRSHPSRNSQRHEDLRVLALNQQRDVLAGVLRLVLELLHRLHALTVDAEDDVTRLHARGGGRPCYLFDDEIALRLRLFLFLR